MNHNVLHKVKVGDIRGECYDCGLKYTNFPCDLVLPNRLWELISPSESKESGLLCPNCICHRLTAGLGLSAVNVTVDLSELINDTAKN